MRVVERAGGLRVATLCECRLARRTERLIETARVPERYRECTLDTFVPNYAGQNPSLWNALEVARNFVRTYPLDTAGKGLLFVGSVGLGKTHLAVGVLQALIKERGAKGIFCDYRGLLKQIQDSYGRHDLSERDVLGPIFEAEVLVIDELGAAKPTEWVWDTVQHILNTRYNDRKTTIVTTNYRDEAETPEGLYANLPENKRDAKTANHQPTLGDRITERMRSRLHEMCVVVEMSGNDFRQTAPGRASLSNRKYKANEFFQLVDTPSTVVPAARPGVTEVPKSAPGRPVGQIAIKKEKYEVSAEVDSKLLQPDKVWTQEEIDQFVAVLTAKQNQNLSGGQ